VTIPVATVQNVIKLPNTALRYKPSLSQEEILALYKQYGIEGGERRLGSNEVAAAEKPLAAGPNAIQPRTPRADNAVVWKLHRDNSMEPVKVALGITDHAYTEVTSALHGELKEGDELVVRTVLPKSSAPGGPGGPR